VCGLVGVHKADTVYGKSISIKAIGLSLWVVAVAIQFLWWIEEQKAAPTMLVLAGGIIGTTFFFRRNILSRYPISASMMLGYSTYLFLLPPIATLLERKPLTNNLDHPVMDFLHIFICFLVLMGAHFIYRNWNLLQNLRWFIAERVYKPVNFFSAPSNLHLLAMGGIGLMATYLQVFVGGGVQQELLGVGNKFMQALFVLAYLPFVTLVRPTMGDDGGVNRKWLCILVGYTILLLILSIARNSRTVFLLGLASIGLVYIYGHSIGIFNTRIFSVKRLAIAALGTVIVLGPIADIATSMVIARGERGDISAKMLVLRTVDIFSDKRAIRARRLESLDENTQWDERYVDNQFMARLANIKFVDNSLDLALMMDTSDRSYFREIEIQRSLSVLPRPLLQGLGLSVDKDFVLAFSGGDLLLYTVTGNDSVLGEFRAGSIFGSGYALFGWGYPFVLSILALLLFAMADSLTSRIAIARPDRSSAGWLPVLSPMAVIGFFTWFSYFTSAARGLDSFSSLTNYLLRGWLEGFFVYAFAYWITYFVVKPFSKIAN
jgi:hypothetical protein